MKPADTRGAACEAGCTVTSEHDDNGVPRLEVSCADGWAAARFLVALAKRDGRDATTAIVQEWARRAASNGTLAMRARSVFEAMQRSVRFEREKGEIFQAPAVTLAKGVGDCDCHARVTHAALQAVGVPVRFAFLHRGAGPSHVLCQAWTGDRWEWLETTVRGARFGEHPIAAARRCGVIRPDVGGEMESITMGGWTELQGGKIYRARVGVAYPDDVGDRAEFVRGVMVSLGFSDVSVWLAPPQGFAEHAKAPVASASWSAWIEALYARPECRVFPSPNEIIVPADVREGGIPVVVDDVHEWAAAEAPPPPSTLPELGAVQAFEPVHTKDHSDGFYVKLVELARRHRMDPEHIAAVMLAESGLFADVPRGRPGYLAAGIFQLVFPTTAQAEAFKRKTAEEQLDAFEAFIAPMAASGQLTTPERIYQVNFLPGSVARGRELGTAVCVKDGTGYDGAEASFYKDNAGLDVDRDGRITLQDLGAVIGRAKGYNASRWKEIVTRIKLAREARQEKTLGA